MVDRYHSGNRIAPETGKDNAKELSFDGLDSGYKVGTAGSKEVGRSDTIQYFHGSEVAFWEAADKHTAGILQAVPDEPDTEIMFESTANGVGNYFHHKCMSSIDDDEWITVFIPWFWQDEYKRDIKGDIKKSEEEREIQKIYELSDEQLSWRRSKIKDLGSERLFKQEYPNNVEEAFQDSAEDSFIPPHLVSEAMKATVEGVGPLVLGVDVARFGVDRTSFCLRKGRKVLDIWSYEKIDTMACVGHIVNTLRERPVDKVFIDVIGVGAGVVDRMREEGYGDKVIAVNAAEKALNKDRYSNKRAEMWGNMKEWLEEKPVELPNNNSLRIDLSSPSYDVDSSGRLRLEKKEDMKKRGYRSPDEGDSLALTFAKPLFAVGSVKSLKRNRGIV